MLNIFFTEICLSSCINKKLLKGMHEQIINVSNIKTTKYCSQIVLMVLSFSIGLFFMQVAAVSIQIFFINSLLLVALSSLLLQFYPPLNMFSTCHPTLHSLSFRSIFYTLIFKVCFSK